MPEDGFWQKIHVAPGGQEIFIPDYLARIVVLSTATHSVLRTLTVPNDEYIEGMNITPSGRLFVVGLYTLFELNPATGAVVQTTEVPGNWWGGPIVFNSDASLGFIVGGDEIYLAQLDPLRIVHPATMQAFTDAGLASQNPSWGDDWYRVWDLRISPDNDRLYLIGDGKLKIISGLNGTVDYTGLSLSVHELGANAWNDQSDNVEIYLSQDGSWLLDSYGDIYNTDDMVLMGSLGFAPLHHFDPLMIAMSPDESLLFCGGWAGNTEDVSESGEYLLVSSMSDFSVLDLDNDASNGLTGIKLPDGRYNVHHMRFTPDGNTLYIAGGSSGALVIELERDPSDSISPNHGAQGEWITLNVTGSFPANSTVRLESAGGLVTEGLEVQSLALGGLGLRFDLSAVAIGTYDLVVAPPTGSEVFFAQSFVVESLVADASVDLVGDREFLAVDQARVQVVVESNANFDIEDLVVSLLFEEGTRYRLTLPSRVGGGADQVDVDFTAAQAGVPEHIWIHRMTAGRSIYRFWLEIDGPDGVLPENWDIWSEITVGFLKPSSQPVTWGLFGDMCAFGDALVTSIRKESSRNGYDFSRAEITDSVRNVTRDTASNFGVAKVTGMVVVAVFTLAGGPVAWAVSIAMDLDACFGFVKKLFGFNHLFSFDPNDKLSFSGIDGYVNGQERLRYQILFENQADATAAAQTVIVTDQLDASTLDLTSFTMDRSSHDNEMTVNLNRMTGELEVRFDAINLPANVTPPEGQGWFEYSVNMKPNLESGIEIHNQASIVFDLNAPILTSEVVHTIDTEAPGAAVEALDSSTIGDSVEVHWSAQEDGVGVWTYDVYVSVDDGIFELWQDATSATSAHYQGNIDEHLAFYAVARDRLGNSDPAKTLADTETLLGQEGHTDLEKEDSGCGCASGNKTSNLWFGLAAVLVLVRRRRKNNLATCTASGSLDTSKH